MANIAADTRILTHTANVIIFLALSFAFSICPEPRSCPTIMAMASPIAKNTILKRLPIVFAILSPPTTPKPLTE